MIYDHTLAQKQKVINWEKFDISGIAVNFFAKFIKLILRRIQATYFANFIAIFGCFQKLSQFKLKLFKLNKYLNCHSHLNITLLIFTVAISQSFGLSCVGTILGRYTCQNRPTLPN